MAIGQIGKLRDTLKQLQSYDGTFDEAFSAFRRDVQGPATRILVDKPSQEKKKRYAKEIQRAVEKIERDMLATVRAVRAAKDRLNI